MTIEIESGTALYTDLGNVKDRIFNGSRGIKMKKFEDLTYSDLSSPRYARATRFANLMLSMMSGFVPSDAQCKRRIYDYLLRIAYEENYEIISVPPECDEFDRIRLERARYAHHAQFAGADIPDLHSETGRGAIIPAILSEKKE
jgi:hypothetical protein